MIKKIALCCLLLVAVDSFALAQQVVAYAFRDSVLNEVALWNGEEAFERMRMKYRFKKADASKLKHLYMEREKEKNLANKADFSAQNIIWYKDNIDSVYSDSIYRYLIPENKISSENLTCALKYSKRIELDEAQYEYLMFCALRMAHRLEKDPLKNLWDEEMDILRKTLTSKQMRNMLILKHKNAIQKDINKVWTELKKVNLTNEVDSAKEYSKARMYIALKYCINDVYRHKSGERRNNLEELKKKRPLLIKMYDALVQRKQEKKEEEDYKEFIW